MANRKPTRFGPRLWIPLVLGATVIVITVYLWRELSAQQRAHLGRTIESETARIENRITSSGKQDNVYSDSQNVVANSDQAASTAAPSARRLS